MTNTCILQTPKILGIYCSTFRCLLQATSWKLPHRRKPCLHVKPCCLGVTDFAARSRCLSHPLFDPRRLRSKEQNAGRFSRLAQVSWARRGPTEQPGASNSMNKLPWMVDERQNLPKQASG